MGANERVGLLWKVLIYKMTPSEVKDMFIQHGQEPPDETEVSELQLSTLRNLREKRSNRGPRTKRKKPTSQKRWLNNEQVTVSIKDKYLHTPKESAEDKAKSSVELYIVGIGRGGRHAVKIAREQAKRGPVSSKKALKMREQQHK